MSLKKKTYFFFLSTGTIFVMIHASQGKVHIFINLYPSNMCYV